MLGYGLKIDSILEEYKIADPLKNGTGSRSLNGCAEEGSRIFPKRKLRYAKDRRAVSETSAAMEQIPTSTKVYYNTSMYTFL